jgi:hypothetical protein
LAGLQKILYNAHDVANAKTVVVTEGERKADAVHDLGLIDSHGKPVAVTTSGGATSWKLEYIEEFHGKRVLVFADSELSGKSYAQAVQSSLELAGIPCKAFFFDQFRDDDERADVRDDLINQHRDKEGHVDKARAREALVEFLDCKWIPEASPIVEAVDDVQV